MPSTPRWGLPYPSGSDLISTGDDAIQALATQLDDVTKLSIGPAANRPPQPVTAGRYYLSTDAQTLDLSDGNNWLQIAPGVGTVPIGTMVDYAGGTDPAGGQYLIADGRTLPTVDYPELNAVLGTAYNTGNEPAGHVRLPDTRGRTTVGPDSSAARGAAGRLSANNTRGAVGGTESHLLTAAQSGLPGHGHAHTISTQNNGSHSHGGATVGAGAHSHGGATGFMDRNTSHAHNAPGNVVFVTGGNGGSAGVAGAGTSTFSKQSSPITTATDTNHLHGIAAEGNHTHTINSDGTHGHTILGGVTNAAAVDASGAHPNTQPYVVVPKLIRVK